MEGPIVAHSTETFIDKRRSKIFRPEVRLARTLNNDATPVFQERINEWHDLLDNRRMLTRVDATVGPMEPGKLSAFRVAEKCSLDEFERFGTAIKVNPQLEDFAIGESAV